MLNPLQRYCLHVMKIPYYSKRPVQLSKPYQVFYKLDDEVQVEADQRTLLANILKALKWDSNQVEITGFYNMEECKVLESISNEQALSCGLVFGEVNLNLNNNNILILPKLSELELNVQLKKKVWDLIKPFCG